MTGISPGGLISDLTKPYGGICDLRKLLEPGGAIITLWRILEPRTLCSEQLETYKSSIHGK